MNQVLSPNMESSAFRHDRGGRPGVWLLVSIGVIGQLSIHMIAPGLPHLQTRFGTDYGAIQLLISVYFITFGTAQLFVGPLADMLGRRRTLIGGLIVYTLASALCALAPSFEVLLAGRALQAVGACTGIVLPRAIIRDHYDSTGATRALGYLSMGLSMGTMLAPLAGGLLFDATGWRGLFWALTAVGLVSTSLAWARIGESGTIRSGAGSIKRLFGDTALLLQRPRFLLFVISLSFPTGVFYSFVIGAPYLAAEFWFMPPKLYGIWFASTAIGYAIGNFLAGRLITRFRSEVMIFVGASLLCLVMGLFLAALASGQYSPPVIFGIVGLATLVSGLVMPASFSGALSENHELAGSASGLGGFLQFATAAAFSTIASLAMEHWHHPLALGVVMSLAAIGGLVTASMLLHSRPAATSSVRAG